MATIEERGDPQTRRYAGLAGDDEGETDQRPPLVLLHGLSFDRTLWAPARARLRRIDAGRRVLALDLPGHGESTGTWSYDGEAVGHAVHEAVLAAGLEAPVLVGHSYSGILATIYASRYPAGGVVNVDQPLQTGPFAGFLQSRADQLRGPGFAAFWAMLAASMHPELLPPDGQRLVATTCRPQQDVLLGYWREVLERPTEELAAILEGALGVLRDRNLPYVVVSGHEPEPEYRRWLAEVLPQATITVWPDSGHFPQVAHPDEFAHELAATATWAR